MTEIRTLVIGYGNRLRGDDGVGPAMAEIVKGWHIPGVRALIRQQLVPELAEEIKCVRRVVFIDARLDLGERSYAVQVVEPKMTRGLLGHHETPENFLALALALDGSAPEAWLVTIPAFSLEYGEEITAHARAQMEAALTWLRAWLATSV
jgi:hydrogenase maturation protease